MAILCGIPSQAPVLLTVTMTLVTIMNVVNGRMMIARNNHDYNLQPAPLFRAIMPRAAFQATPQPHPAIRRKRKGSTSTITDKSNKKGTLDFSFKPFGPSLLEGRWTLFSSNDVLFKHQVVVEVHADHTFQLLGGKNALLGFSTRYYHTGKLNMYHHPIPDDDDDDVMVAEGCLHLYPRSQYIESFAGISVPLPEPNFPIQHYHDPIDNKNEPQDATLLVEDRDHLTLFINHTRKFYVFERSAIAPHDPVGHRHEVVPISTLVSTNILGWLVANLLSTVQESLLSHASSTTTASLHLVQ